MESRKLLANARIMWALMAGLLIGFFMAQMFSSIRNDNSTNGACAIAPSQYHGNESPNEQNKEILRNIPFDSHNHSHEDNSIAEQLYKEVRVLCWIMTNPKNHESVAIHVKRTWGKRCNKLLIMSSEEDSTLGTIALPVNEGRNNLWSKTKEAFKYIFEHHLEEADWFFKADDDTYTIMENLRYMLYPYPPEIPIYFGCKLKPYISQGYMSGGAGYVLSQEALRRLGPELLNKDSECNAIDESDEDVHMGYCLEELNVIAGDSRDAFGRGRFFPFPPEDHLVPQSDLNWYLNYSYYEPMDGLECCSDNAVSFHYIEPQQMYAMDYLIYHLHPVGIAKLNEKLPPKLNTYEVMRLY